MYLQYWGFFNCTWGVISGSQNIFQARNEMYTK